MAIVALIRKLLAGGTGVEGVRMLKRIAERDIRRDAAAGDETALAEHALRIRYQRRRSARRGHGGGALPAGRAAAPSRPPGGHGPRARGGPGRGPGPRNR